MTTPLDSKVNPKVLKMLNKRAPTLTVRRYLSEVDNDSDGSTTPGAPTDLSIKGFGPLAYKKGYINNDLIEVGDCYFVTAVELTNATPFVPVEGDLLPRLGKIWRVVSIETYSAGDDPAAYVLQVRS